MKTLIALTLSVLSLHSYAGQVFALDRGYKQALTFECVEKNAKQECQKFSVIRNLVDELGYEHTEIIGQTIDREDLKEIAKAANYHMGKIINGNYLTVATIGKDFGVALIERNVPLSVSRGILLLGITTDILKAPAVGVAYVGSETAHILLGKMKMNKLVNFLADVDSKEEAKITNGHYDALLCAIMNVTECAHWEMM